jgi:hypothetical protein
MDYLFKINSQHSQHKHPTLLGKCPQCKNHVNIIFKMKKYSNDFTVFSVNLSDIINNDKNVNIISTYITNTFTNDDVDVTNIVTNCENFQHVTLTIPSSIYNRVNPNSILINVKTQPNLIDYHIRGTFIKNPYIYSV